MALLIERLAEKREPEAALEYVELSWQERSRPRLRCKSSSGRELTLSLPRGTVLSDGDVLASSGEYTIIVRAASEPVLVIEPANARQLCLLAHHLGNWHRPIQFESANRILAEPDRPLEDWLKRSQISYRLESCAYQPNMHETHYKITVEL